MRLWLLAACCVCLVGVPQASGQEETLADEEPALPSAAEDAAPSPFPPDASPPELVREGNKRYLAKDFPTALEYYDKAKEGAPDALEVDFNRGLGRFAQGEFEQAREAFARTMLSKDQTLADDAVYSLATCDHAEAIAAAQTNPQDAITKLESAMRRYQDVLTSNHDHELARESNRKAATLWRQLKEIQQQQQQDRNQQQDQQKEDQDQDQQQQQKQSGEDQQENQDQPQPTQPQEGEDRQQQPQQEGDEDEQKQAGEEQPEAQAAGEEERASREQAERQLRRLMDRLRRRKQDRQEISQPVRVRPVEKDW